MARARTVLFYAVFAFLILGCGSPSDRILNSNALPVTLPPLMAPPEPTGDGLAEFREVLATYGAMKTFQATVRWSMTENGIASAQSERLLIYAAPNRFRLNAVTGNMNFNAVSDGREVTEWTGSSAERLWAPRSPAELSTGIAGDFQLAGSLLMKFFGGPPALEEIVDARFPVVSLAGPGEDQFTLKFRAVAPYGSTTLIVHAPSKQIQTITSNFEPKVEEAGKARVEDPLTSLVVRERFENRRVDGGLSPQTFVADPPPAVRVRDSRIQREGAEGLVGRLAPNFDLPGPDGKNVSLESLRGKIVLIEFWSPKLFDAAQTMKLTLAVKEGLKDLPVRVLAISTEDPAFVEVWRREQGLPPIPAFQDKDRKVMQAYGLFDPKAKEASESVPTHVVIDREGVVVGTLPRVAGTVDLIRMLRRAGLDLSKADLKPYRDRSQPEPPGPKPQRGTSEQGSV